MGSEQDQGRRLKQEAGNACEGDSDKERDNGKSRQGEQWGLST